MERAEWLQETRKMRFEEAYGGWQGGRLMQEEAARLLGICERTFRRFIDRYEEGGLDGLFDKRLHYLTVLAMRVCQMKTAFVLQFFVVY